MEVVPIGSLEVLQIASVSLCDFCMLVISIFQWGLTYAWRARRGRSVDPALAHLGQRRELPILPCQRYLDCANTGVVGGNASLSHTWKKPGHLEIACNSCVRTSDAKTWKRAAACGASSLNRALSPPRHAVLGYLGVAALVVSRSIRSIWNEGRWLLV